ncbi:hypothetical protein B0H12DRAFT_1238712 [Mycena haematopus]|nr:hypothetical protein B0H12DRAFT_1238712 [Mycena haematopus]
MSSAGADTSDATPQRPLVCVPGTRIGLGPRALSTSYLPISPSPLPKRVKTSSPCAKTSALSVFDAAHPETIPVRNLSHLTSIGHLERRTTSMSPRSVPSDSTPPRGAWLARRLCRMFRFSPSIYAVLTPFLG